jgi:hypothetical protein
VEQLMEEINELLKKIERLGLIPIRTDKKKIM